MTPREALLAAIDGQWWECENIETERELIDYFWRGGSGLQGEMYPDLDEQSYHTGPGLSNSGLKKVDQSVSHYVAGLREAGSMPTPALVAGRIINDAILQPAVFEDPHRYRVIEPYGRLTPGIKDDIATGHDGATYLRQTGLGGTGAKVYLASGGKLLTHATSAPAHDAPICMDKGLRDAVVQLRLAMLKHPEARRIFTDPDTTYEESYYWMDEETGLLLRGRTDVRLITGFIVDLKTAVDGSPDAFRKAVWRFGYYRQAGMYLDGYEQCSGEEPKGFFWLVVDKSTPTVNGVWLPYPDEYFLERGREETRASLRKFSDWIAEAEKVGLADAWPGYPRGLSKLSYHREDAA